jgi:ADP-heptose:LPS heptosyltransferase
MRRSLGPLDLRRPRIALVTNDALGNYVVATPLVQMLKASYPESWLDWHCGSRAAEFVEATEGVDRHIPWLGMAPKDLARHAAGERYDLVINNDSMPYALAAAAMLCGEETQVVGPCLDATGRAPLPFADDAAGDLARDERWLDPDLALRHPVLRSGYIGEIFCRLAHLDGPVPRPKTPWQEPGRNVPDVLIAASASLPDKIWSLEGWRTALGWLRSQGRSIGLLGAKPKAQGRFWLGADLEQTLVDEGLVEDLRGAFSLPQVAGALRKCRLCLTLDNGIMHLAAAGGIPAIALFRHGFPALWMPPDSAVAAVESPAGQPVAEIRPDEVLAALMNSEF